LFLQQITKKTSFSIKKRGRRHKYLLEPNFFFKWTKHRGGRSKAPTIPPPLCETRLCLCLY